LQALGANNRLFLIEAKLSPDPVASHRVA